MTTTSLLHSIYYKILVTRKLLTIIILGVTLTSFLWATLDAMFKGRVEIVKLTKVYIALSAHTILN